MLAGFELSVVDVCLMHLMTNVGFPVRLYSIDCDGLIIIHLAKVRKVSINEVSIAYGVVCPCGGSTLGLQRI
jgi:hypothetical protein